MQPPPGTEPSIVPHKRQHRNKGYIAPIEFIAIPQGLPISIVKHSSYLTVSPVT